MPTHVDDVWLLHKLGWQQHLVNDLQHVAACLDISSGDAGVVNGGHHHDLPCFPTQGGRRPQERQRGVGHCQQLQQKLATPGPGHRRKARRALGDRQRHTTRWLSTQGYHTHAQGHQAGSVLPPLTHTDGVHSNTKQLAPHTHIKLPPVGPPNTRTNQAHSLPAQRTGPGSAWSRCTGW